MEYKTGHRRSMQSVLTEWKLWLFIYIMTLVISTLVLPSLENQVLIIRIMSWELITGLPIALYIDLMCLFLIIIFTVVLAAFIRVRVAATLRKDALLLREPIIYTPTQIGTC